MYLITAIIKPGRLEAVHNALTEAGYPGVTVSDVRGHGTQGGQVEYYRGQKITDDFRNKVRLELVVAGDRLDLAVDTIVEAARTGEIGDGKVWVTSVERVVRVRTGETGTDAV